MYVTVVRELRKRAVKGNKREMDGWREQRCVKEGKRNKERERKEGSGCFVKQVF